MKTKLKRYAMPVSIVGCLILIYLCTIVGITSIPFGEANRILLHEVLHMLLIWRGYQPVILRLSECPAAKSHFGLSDRRSTGSLWCCLPGDFQEPHGRPFYPWGVLWRGSGRVDRDCHALFSRLPGIKRNRCSCLCSAFLAIFLGTTFQRSGEKCRLLPCC